MSVRLLDNRVLVKPIQEEATDGGILIPTAAQQKSDTGLVEAVGEGKFNEKGDRLAMSVKTGDKVIYSKYSGTEIKLNGSDYMIVREEDIMGVLA